MLINDSRISLRNFLFCPFHCFCCSSLLYLRTSGVWCRTGRGCDCNRELKRARASAALDACIFDARGRGGIQQSCRGKVGSDYHICQISCIVFFSFMFLTSHSFQYPCLNCLSWKFPVCKSLGAFLPKCCYHELVISHNY